MSWVHHPNNVPFNYMRTFTRNPRLAYDAVRRVPCPHCHAVFSVEHVAPHIRSDRSYAGRPRARSRARSRVWSTLLALKEPPEHLFNMRGPAAVSTVKEAPDHRRLSARMLLNHGQLRYRQTSVGGLAVQVGRTAVPWRCNSDHLSRGGATVQAAPRREHCG